MPFYYPGCDQNDAPADVDLSRIQLGYVAAKSALRITLLRFMALVTAMVDPTVTASAQPLLCFDSSRPMSRLSRDELWMHAKSVWLQRVISSRDNFGRGIQATGWLSSLAISENMIITGVAAIVSTALRGDLLTNCNGFFTKDASRPPLSIQMEAESLRGAATSLSDSMSDRALLLTSLCCGGGWPPCVVAGRLVDIFPRALFLTGDPKGLEHSIFPCAAAVLQVGSGVSASAAGGIGGTIGRPGVWLGGCAGTFLVRGENFQDSTPRYTLPRGPEAVVPATEMVRH